MSLARLLRTVRYLKPVQVYGRIWRRAWHPRPDTRPAPPTRRLGGPPLGGVRRAASMTGPEAFPFLNVPGVVRTAADWDDPRHAALWRYNLHYFDDLNADNAGARAAWHAALIRRWITENPPPRGVGWDPYPTSLRVVNWIKWRARASGQDDAVIDQSLATQVRYLRKRLERHLLGNHLWANAKALAFAGVFFSGAEGDRWLRDGLALIERELAEQILSDGGHFERSPMYHCIVLEDVLDIAAYLRLIGDGRRDDMQARLAEAATRMLRWLRVMTHPDGQIAQFNDAAFGIAPNLAALEAYAHSLGIDVGAAALGDLEMLLQSGYVRMHRGDAVVICDVAPVGPDHLPGHAHADTLSFELSLHGRRVLVNGGTSTYAPGARRQHERGTAAHNTVVIDGQDSSEVWDSFRVGRRARVRDVITGRDDAAIWLEAVHDGNRRTAGVLHRRRWTLRDGELVVLDHVVGPSRPAVAYFHLHPEIDVRSGAGHIAVTAREELAPVHIIAAGARTIRFLPDAWSPEFGATMPSTTIAAEFDGASLSTTVRW